MTTQTQIAAQALQHQPARSAPQRRRFLVQPGPSDLLFYDNFEDQSTVHFLDAGFAGISFVTSPVLDATGTYALEVASTVGDGSDGFAGISIVDVPALSALDDLTFTTLFRTPSLPAADAEIAEYGAANGALNVFLRPDGKLQGGTGGAARGPVGPTVLAANAVYRLEIRFLFDGATSGLSVVLDGVPQLTDYSYTVSPTDAQRWLYWGPYQVATTTFYYDDVAVYLTPAVPRLVFSFDVVVPSGAAGATGTQRLVFSFNVIAPAQPPIRLVFAFNVIPAGQRLIFCFDVIPVELYDASLADMQMPISEVTKTPAGTFAWKSFDVTSNIATPADRWSLVVTDTEAYRTRTPNDRYSLSSGLIEGGTRRLYQLIRDGIPDFHTADLAPKAMATTTITGRDGMMYLQDGRFSRIYRYGPRPALIAGQNPIQEVNGLFRASDIALDVVAAGGLRLVFQMPDYFIWNLFQAIGRPIDILITLARPFSLVEARKVDVWSDKNVVYMRQRQLKPQAWPGMTLSAHDLRISKLSLRSFQTAKIGRVTLRGRVTPGGGPSGNNGVMTTPPAGVPIPHDTELVPFGGGSPVPIYSGPVTVEATLLPSSQATPIGTVQNPDGSTLGVGTVQFTENRVAVNVDGAGWPIPSGTILRPDGLLTYTDSGFVVVVPPGFNSVQNHDGSVTTVHP